MRFLQPPGERQAACGSRGRGHRSRRYAACALRGPRRSSPDLGSVLQKSLPPSNIEGECRGRESIPRPRAYENRIRKADLLSKSLDFLPKPLDNFEKSLLDVGVKGLSTL